MAEQNIDSVRMLTFITQIMGTQYGKEMNPLKWFYCFGTLQEYICDLTFGLNFDIDIGIMYDEYTELDLLTAFEGHGFKCVKRVINDVTGKPLNMHFKASDGQFGTMPTVDVYAWYEHKGMLYHTYDIEREGKEVPSTYTFKGIKKEWLCPDPDTIARIRNSGPEMNQVLDLNGVWHYSIFGDHSGYEFLCPFAYGSVLDCWDPGWKFRDYRRGQSKTPWVKMMKSCKEWGKI